jgi:hypothetical protein
VTNNPEPGRINETKGRQMKRLFIFAGIAAALIGTATYRAEALAPLQQIGNTVYDPNSGLEWLDLNLTAGQSYNSVLNGWNGYTTTMGFQFATRDQVIQLFGDAGASYYGTPPAPTTADLQPASVLLSLLGTTLAQSDLSQSFMFYDPSTEPTLPSPAYVPSATFGVGTIFAGYPQEGFFDVPGIFPSLDYSSPEMASALVRVVPEPSTGMLAMICLCLSLLAMKGRKRDRSANARSFDSKQFALNLSKTGE